MRNILVPTDFSPVADNALTYALEVAAAFKATIYLYHVYHIHKVEYDLNRTEEDQPFKKRVERQLELTKMTFTSALEEKGLQMHTLSDQDGIIPLFTDKAASLGIDLIIMGSKGASGLEKIVFGSVASTVMEMAKIPVLVVPPKHTFESLKRIVLATDGRTIHATVLAPLLQIASLFEPQLTLLRIIAKTTQAHSPTPELALEGIETTYREVPVVDTINATINTYIKADSSDLLCMVRRKKGFLESLFKKSITKAQVYSNQVPLLVLPEINN